MRCRPGGRGFEKNREEKISGIVGIMAAVPFMNREKNGRIIAA